MQLTSFQPSFYHIPWHREVLTFELDRWRLHKVTHPNSDCPNSTLHISDQSVLLIQSSSFGRAPGLNGGPSGHMDSYGFIWIHMDSYGFIGSIYDPS